MKIAFYAGSCIPIHAHSLEERPLGGTESGLIRLAEILEARGHDVTVYSSMKQPPPSRPRYVFQDEILRARDLDILVVVQNLDAVFHGIQCQRLFFWTGDGPDQYANFGLGDGRVVERIEKLITVSSWQTDSLCESSGFPRAKTHTIGNGVHLPLFQGTETRRRKRLMYASAPYRGLELIPAIFQEVKKTHPDAELAVFAGMQLYDRETPFQGPEKALEKKLQGILSRIPDCHVSPPITQAALAREYMRSSVLVYPNTVFETCCMVAIEAIAAGTPVIASATSALPETVGRCGFVVPGTPGSPQYMTQFIATTNRLLTDDLLWSDLSEQCFSRTHQELSWEKVADRFELMLQSR